MDLHPLADILGIIASLVTIAGVLIAAVRFAVAKRPPNHPLILAGSIVALLAMAGSILIVSFHLIPSVSTSFTVANAVAIGGLIISLPSWIAALVSSYRLRSRVWLVSLLLGGLIPYISAIVSNNIIAYLLAAAVPG